jgi:DICT domain-containing protein
MTARPEVVALLTDFEVKRNGADQRFVHRDGRPFTAEEVELIGTATDEDMRAAAGHLATATQRLTEMIAPYIRAAEDTDRPPEA